MSLTAARLGGGWWRSRYAVARRQWSGQNRCKGWLVATAATCDRAHLWL